MPLPLPTFSALSASEWLIFASVAHSSHSGVADERAPDMMIPTGRRGEMVDALDSKSGILTDVSVRVRPSVL